MDDKVVGIEAVREVRSGLLTPAQAAEVIGVSPATLAKWRWCGRYNLPFLKIARQVFYRGSDVAAFLDPRREASRKVQPHRRRRARNAA